MGSRIVLGLLVAGLISLSTEVDAQDQVFARSILLNAPTGEVLEKAGRCDECGECEKRCPFGLPIMSLIKEARTILAEVIG